MKRKWIRRVSWILLTPIILFVILMVLLYVPPVQNLIRREVTAYASKATGMQIQVERIDLRFPLNLLVRGVEVIQQPDTLLSLESLNVRVQAWPLLKGKVEVDEVTLSRVAFNSANLIDGMEIKGVLGRFFLQSHGVDLSNETAVINATELSDTHVQMLMNDTTTTPKDTTASAPVNWKVDLHQLKLKNVSFSMQLPADSMRMAAHIGEATIDDAQADLKNQFYGLKQFLLSGTSASYDTGAAKPVEGFDASHIAVRDVSIGLDSLLYKGRDMKAVIREFTMNERSGLSVTSLTGRAFSNDSIISVPGLKLQTPHSEIDLSAHTYWELVNIPTTGRLSANLNAYIGKEDVMLFTGGLPDSFKEAYPFRPLVIRAGTDGNLKEMQISRFTADLPGAFSLEGGGILENLADSITRSGTIGLKMKTQNLNFLTGLSGEVPNGTLVIPDSMNLVAQVDIKGPEYKANLHLKEGQGAMNVNAALNTATEVYKADLKIDNLQLHHFLPKDSIYELSLSAAADGCGLDVMSYRSYAKLDLALDRLHYAQYHLSNVHLTGALKGALVTANLTSDNELLKMTTDAEYNLAHSYPDGKVTVDVIRLDLHELGLMPEPMKRPLAFNLSAEARQNRVFTHFISGDMKLNLSARSGVNPLISQSTRFVDVLMKQIDEKELNHAELRKALPTAVLSFSAGKENPLAYFLATKNISYHEASMKFGTAPDWGINGKAAVHALKVDTLQLDTVFFTVKQDTTLMKLRAGVINGPKNPQFSFSTTLTGEIRDRDAELLVDYKNGKGETGVLLGVNARPLFEGQGKGNGIAFTLIPEKPIVAFQQFHFNENHNWIYLHKNMRVYANVDMWDEEGMGFRVHSMQGDTVSLQNIDVEIRRIRLQEITSVLPYFPEVTGLFSLEAHYIQTEKDLQLSAEASIDELTYERQRIGDIALGATWLPGEQGKQYLNAYLNHDQVEVLVADGKLLPTRTGKDSLEVNTTLEHFPLRVANAFIPDQMVTLSGDMDGNLNITGSTEQPLINGELVLDSVAVFSSQYGARFVFDNRPVQIKNNRLLFDKFAIYTTSKNPFTIDGYVDFRDMSRPMANLNMLAQNYTLLDAKRTRESLVYGKVFADFRATVKGPLDGLNMRGNVSLLGNTDVSYVLTDSPLTVQDRLGSLVTFTSFSDTTTVVRQEVPTVSLGGLDMVMMVHIDPSVRVKVDLDASNDNRIELEGGGDLSMKYTPQGDLTLTGRYTLSGGLMKYALPVIVAKEFAIDNGSYVEWTGNPMDPMLNFKATDRTRASVSEGENGGSRMVNFDVSVVVKNRLDNLSFAFDVSAPEDATVQNELTAMGAEERGKQALYIMVMKTYLGTGPIGGGGGGLGKLNMGSALTSVLSSQINSLMGNLKNASLSVGVEDHDDSETGSKRTDYSFRYSQRLFNNRFQIVIGGKVSQGENATNDAESFIDNISLEYRLDRTGTRYIRLFYDKNYESVLEGEITETGVGIVLRKKLDKLSELFIFKKKK
ncbi:translocation/assembly module TamB domain-containing protein [Bacteroides caecimuris]|uniref:Translocation/assembly module TamB n=1 Tax=Bacteroides caecimuris TaxID=1796613 RepID=A0A1C7GXK5_9BACE|nr:translocation/assembly module TamB domain-containing protein [Bacteroides caecimuris]ANU56320.1 translocation/assembly module TamB [Bacteroides caecimuris]OXE63784.1 translocation/assembly module TamB [Bacteroides caecimuris]QQR18838.1 translocation/assembly module TamB domain-containing protein [Bacteroides caecimuris]UQA31865.1 translocation/assembly module TamB [Bacteroides caecimuris]